MPKFIVTIDDLLPPTYCIILHSQTMPDGLSFTPPLFRHRQKYSDVLNVRRCTLLSDVIIGSGAEVVAESS